MGMMRCDGRYCVIGTTFNSFDSTAKHEFVKALETFLAAAKQLACVPKGLRFFFRSKERKCKESCEMLKKHIAELLAKRKAQQANPAGSMPDLLDLMLEGIDSETGKSISAANIAFQVRSAAT